MLATAVAPDEQMPELTDDDDGDAGGLSDGQVPQVPRSGDLAVSVDAAEEAAQGERQLQLWCALHVTHPSTCRGNGCLADPENGRRRRSCHPCCRAQLGEQALQELLVKYKQTKWTHLMSAGEVEGFTSILASANMASGTERPLDYCVKAETEIPCDPEIVARKYFDVGRRQLWHSSCTESRLIEEVWPRTMCIAQFSYRLDLPIYPRYYCSLVHRANHRLDDEQLIIVVDRSIAHPAMQPRRDVVSMDVFPSGVIITPVKRNGQLHSRVTLVAHFNLRGSISAHLQDRMQNEKLLEVSCFKYLAEFRHFVMDEMSLTAPHCMPSRTAQYETDLASEKAPSLIYASSVSS